MDNKTQKRNSQLDMFENELAKVITAILDSPQQPSAAELLKTCQHLAGETARFYLKEAVITLLGSKQLNLLQKQFLQHIVDDRSLDNALADNNPDYIKAKIQTGIDQLLAASIRFRKSQAFQDMIDFMGKFRDYAPFNNMLIRVQNPSCNFFATEKDWRERFQRNIIEDARPMLILAPMHPVMLVYDFDSTFGGAKTLPDMLKNLSNFKGKWDDKLLKKLIENAERYKIKIEFKNLSSSNSGFATLAHYDSGFKMRVVIHDSLDNPSKFGVLCHELAHIFLGHLGGDSDHWWPSRASLGHNSMEIEAEAVAYIVASHYELEGSSAAYVSSHLKGKDEIPESVSLDNIGKVASKLTQMANKLMPKPSLKLKK